MSGLFFSPNRNKIIIDNRIFIQGCKREEKNIPRAPCPKKRLLLAKRGRLPRQPSGSK